MATNLPTIQRLYADDFTSAPSWFRDEFVRTFNLFSQPVYSILNQGVSVQANTTEEFYPFSLTSTGIPANDTLSFVPKKFIGKPTGVIMCQCISNTPTIAPIGNPVTFDWVFGSGGAIQILAIYGLTAGIKYTLTVRIC